MSLKNWLILSISHSLFGCACLNNKPAHSADVKVWVIDSEAEGAWGRTRYDSDLGEFKLCREMENYVCFSPEEIPEILRR